VLNYPLTPLGVLSGQGSNCQDVGFSCPLSGVARSPNMEQPKKKIYGKEDEEKRKKKKHLYTFKINTVVTIEIVIRGGPPHLTIG
jgi:hypothetical protein